MNSGAKVLVTLITLLILTSATAHSSSLAAQSPPVLAFYYAWFDQNTWTSGKSVDLPATPYSSADPTTIERHVAQAQSAGIDALVQSWYGPQVENNQTETNFRLLLEVAQTRGFQAAVDFETTSPFLGDAGAVINALTTLLATHAQHPAYLRYQGKPVIFFWRQQRFAVDEWQTIRTQVDPNRSAYWIAEGTDITYQAVFDGHHLYSIAWADSAAGQLSKWGNLLRNYESENQVDRLWVATTMPGYNDTNLPRDNAFAVSRRNGDYFRETWQGALASQPDMIIITSFNEWLEGTHIEPSASFGNLYLEVARELVTELRGSPPAIPPPAELQLAPAQQPPAQDPPANDGPYIQTGSITNVRGGPSTDFEVVGRLAANDTATVVGQNEAGDWWQIEFAPAANGLAWVAAEVVDFVGDASAVPVVAAPAAPAATDQSNSNQSAQAEDAAPRVIIPAGGVNLRSGPGLTFELLGRLEENESALVVGQNEAGDWWQIEYLPAEDGRAWVAAVVVDFEGDRNSVPLALELAAPDTLVTPAPAPPVIEGSVEAIDPVNVRSEPSLEGVILGGLYPGETADVLAVSEDGDWWQIEFAGAPEQTAWVAAEFVLFAGQQNSVPIFGIGTVTPTPGPTNTPTATPAATPTPTLVREQPTFAPTATSVYQATSSALLEARGTPDPPLGESSDSGGFAFSWSGIPWGILSVLAIIGFFWYQFNLRRRRR